MGDWNTLHLFDSKKFYSEIAPDLKGKGKLFDTNFQSKLYWYMTRVDQTDTEILKKIKSLVKNLDSSFRFHKELYEIESRDFKTVLDYKAKEEFIKKKDYDYKVFQKEYGFTIYHYIKLFLLIMFSECAQFNPHLRLGRRIFTGNILATKGSIADECFDYIAYRSIGGIGYDEGHIINWLTHEDAQLLWLDIDNIHPREEESEEYFNAFKNFLQIAVENELGFISVSNVNETVLNMIESPKLNIKIDIKNGFKGHLIKYE